MQDLKRRAAALALCLSLALSPVMAFAADNDGDGEAKKNDPALTVGGAEDASDKSSSESSASKEADDAKSNDDAQGQDAKQESDKSADAAKADDAAKSNEAEAANTAATTEGSDATLQAAVTSDEDEQQLQAEKAEREKAQAELKAQIEEAERKKAEAEKKAAEEAERKKHEKTDKVLTYSKKLINKVGTQEGTGHSICCPSFSCAYGDVVLDGTYHDHSYYTCSCCTWNDWGGGASVNRCVGSSEELLREAYDQILSGRPTVIHVAHGGGEHWVCLIGYKNAKDPDHLSLANFICLDPWDGAKITVSDRYSLYGDGCEHISSR